MSNPIARSRLAPQRARAMTLTEIIVVMSIMIILVSAVVVAVVRISSKGPVQGTKGLLEKLSVGVESFRATYRIYPPQDNGISSTDPSRSAYQSYQFTFTQSSAYLWYELEYDGQGQFMSPVSSAYKVAGGTFNDPKNNLQQTWYYYVDAWQQPLRYLCGPPYTQYTLTSGGPDLIPGTADDIVKP